MAAKPTLPDTYLHELVALLQANTALGRVNHDEVANALRFAEANGWKITKADD